MEKLSRRDFVKLMALGAGAAVCPLAARTALGGETKADSGRLSDHEALAYEKLPDRKVHCLLCPRGCTVSDGERGYCGVRENRGGTYRTLVYARPCALHVDPIEKKPLFHFLPGTMAFSLATAGCNVECKFCQNWQISQSRPEDLDSVVCPPSRIAEIAQQAGCPTIAYTYNEPTVFHEYVLDCAREGNKKGLRSVVISNGFINAEPLKNLCKELAAYKVDLKAFSEEFYRKTVGGELGPVLKTLQLLKELRMHTETVTLLIPGLNDSPEEVRQMAAWVVKNLGADVPMHFTRFQPNYKMTNLSPTPVAALERARDIAKAQGVRYAYVGNVAGHKYENTYCHKCDKKIIGRYSFRILETHLRDGHCEFCGASIPGVWS